MVKIAGIFLGAVFIFWATPGAAQTLVTGAVRDNDGEVITGARVTAFDAAAHVLGNDTTASDGTFAIDANGAPATVRISCVYCAETRIAVRAGEPVVAIVHRYAALRDRLPSAGDLAVLPFRTTTDVLGLTPFAIPGPDGGISDRGLDRGHGALVTDGLSWYSPVDGSDPGFFLPVGAVASYDMLGPAFGPEYGFPANGGTVVASALTQQQSFRVDGGQAGNAVLREGNQTYTGTAAFSSDGGDHYSLGEFSANVPFAGGTLRATAIDQSVEPEFDASGVALDYATGSRRYETFADVSATQTDGSLIAANAPSDEVRADFHVRNRGPLGLEFGVRADRSTGDALLGGSTIGGVLGDDALYVDGSGGSASTHIAASLALQHDSETTFTSGSGEITSLVGSFSLTSQISRYWDAHTDFSNGTRPATFDELVAETGTGEAFFDRSTFGDLALEYTDTQRLRLEMMAYSERIPTGSYERLGGVGVDGAWQIAPLFSLRGWLLDAQSTIMWPGPVTPYGLPGGTNPLRRNLMWFTYGNAIRVDLLARGGPIEGDVAFPITHRSAFVVGSAITPNGKRTTTIGLTGR
jgi:hypothetical protein